MPTATAEQTIEILDGIVEIEYRVAVLEQHAKRMAQEVRRLTDGSFLNWGRQEAYFSFYRTTENDTPNEYIRQLMLVTFREEMADGQLQEL